MMHREFTYARRLAAALAALVLISGCSSSTPPPVPTAQAGFEEGKKLYEKGKWDKARLTFESVVFNHPGSSLVDSAQFLLAMCQYKLKDQIIAASEFQRVKTQYPTSPLIDQADLMRCVCLLEAAPGNPGLDQEQTNTAVDELKQFRDNHPISKFIPAADSLLSVALGRLSMKDYRTGVLYYRMGRFQASRVYFQDMIDQFPKSPMVPDALFYMAEGQLESDSLKAAQDYYEKLIYLYPDHARSAKARKRIARIARDQALTPAVGQTPQ
ncbi:MAG: outer membrane protein assembly factor BamD [candidate division Zixibacteria bacterium]|nr:outer membrane protein assembly factor BamD [candidate division Zixibacteria bacterium]